MHVDLTLLDSALWTSWLYSWHLTDNGFPVVLSVAIEAESASTTVADVRSAGSAEPARCLGDRAIDVILVAWPAACELVRDAART